MSAAIKGLSNRDFAALYAQGRETIGGTARQPRANSLKKTDLRLKHGTGRSRQFNTKITQQLFDLVADACDRHDLTKAEFTERAFKYFLNRLGASDDE